MTERPFYWHWVFPRGETTFFFKSPREGDASEPEDFYRVPEMMQCSFLLGRCLYPNINGRFRQWQELCHGNALRLSWTSGSTEKLARLLPLTGRSQGSLDSQRTATHGYQTQLQINKLPNLKKSSLPHGESWNLRYHCSRSRPCSALDVAGAKCTLWSLRQPRISPPFSGSVLLNAALPLPLHSE